MLHGPGSDTVSAAKTVRDVIQSWVSPTSLALERAMLLWSAITPEWSVTEREAFLSLEDSQHLLGLAGETRPWLHKVGEKYLKMLASEYTTLREPQADTGRLTFATQSLLHEEELQDVMVELIEMKNASLALSITRTEKPLLRHLLLATVCLVALYQKDGIDQAAALVLPLLLHSSKTRGRYLSRLVGELTFLVPSQNFKEYDVADRMECVWQQLVAHGVTLGLCADAAAYERAQLPPPSTNAPPPSGTTALPSGCVALSVDDLYRHKREFATVHLWCTDDDETETVEWRPCTPLEVFEALMAAAARYRKKVRSRAETQKSGAAPSGGLKLADPGFFMNTLHAMLRFQGPLADRMEEDHNLRTIAERAGGWVPLTKVSKLLADHLRQCQQEAPTDVDTIVQQVLTDHDHFGRFQVGVCDVRGNPFEGQVCCRANYGHKLRQPLYRDTLLTQANKVPVAQALHIPLYGWIHVDSALRAMQRDPGLACFDNIPFVAVFASAALRRFRRYKETTLQNHQYDEKLKSNVQKMTFAEVSLRALVRDSHCTVYTCASATRWYVEPGYSYDIVRDAQRSDADAESVANPVVHRHRVLPKLFFTGRRATFRPQQGGAERPSLPQSPLQIPDAAADEAIECARTVVRVPGSAEQEEGDVVDPTAEFAEVVSSAEEAAEIEGAVVSTQKWSLTLDTLPPAVVPPTTTWQSLHAVLRHSGATDSSTLPRAVFPFTTVVTATELEAMFADYPHAPTHDSDETEAHAAELLQNPGAAPVFQPRLAPGQLALSDFEPSLREFIADSEQYLTLIRVPKRTADGAQYANRTSFLKELKAFIQREGLTLTLLRHKTEGVVSDSSVAIAASHDTSEAHTDRHNVSEQANPLNAADVYEVRKAFLWKHSELEKLVSQLGLAASVTSSDRLSLVRTALTRECENKDTNYERLEFIGDALMDFIVSLDACVLKCHLLSRVSAGSEAADPTAAAQLQLNVVMVVCRNSVIAQLLPDAVTRHLKCLYESAAPKEKVEADMFEALVGAVYEMGLGIEQVRLLLMRLFRRLTTLAELPDASADLLAARDACPYTVVSDGACLTSLFHFPSRLIRIVPSALRKHIAPLVDDGAAVPSAHNTHLALVGLPRIQAKGFATHFTTGVQYSYRRLHSRDTSVLWHRILRLVRKKCAAFVNESVTYTTHLVFDYDGEDIRSFNVLRHFWQWYGRQFGCDAAMLVLDCTGPSPSKQNAMKRSCHVHFPQITLTLPQLGHAQSLFRDYLRAQHEKDKQLMTTLHAALRARPAESASTGVRSQALPSADGHRTYPGTPSRARVLFSCARVRALWGEWRKRTDGASRGLHRLDGALLSNLWWFCAGDELVALSHVCVLWRCSVLKFADEVLSRQRPHLYRSFGMADPQRSLLPVESPAPPAASVSHVVVGRVENDSDDFAIVEVLADSPGPGRSAENQHPNQRWLVPHTWLKAAPSMIEGIAVDTVVDASLELSRKLRMYLCDKCDMKYGAEHRPLLFDTLVTSDGIVERVASDRATCQPQQAGDAGAASWEVSLRRACASYRAAVRPASDDEVHASDKTQHVRETACMGGETDEGGEDLEPLRWSDEDLTDERDYPVLASQSAVLRLTSLRSPSYRDVLGRLYEAWAEATPPSHAVTDHESITSSGDCAAICDELPSFEQALLGERRVSASEDKLCVTQWTLWVNAFSALVPKEATDKFKHAVSPSWWAYDAAARRATFYVATEPVFHVPDCRSLREALCSPEEGGKDGMRLLARWLVPHLNYTNDVRVDPQWTDTTSHSTARRDFLPLFVAPTAGKKKASVTSNTNKTTGQATKKRAVVAGVNFVLDVPSVNFVVLWAYASLALASLTANAARREALVPVLNVLRASVVGLLDDGRGTLVVWETADLMAFVHETVPWVRQVPHQMVLPALPTFVARFSHAAGTAATQHDGFGGVLLLHESPKTCITALQMDKMAWRQLFTPATHLMAERPSCVSAHHDVSEAVRAALI